MTNGSERLSASMEGISQRQEEMAARQQYHGEAFDRHEAQLKSILEAIAADGENIRALARIAELRSRRLDGLAGGVPA